MPIKIDSTNGSITLTAEDGSGNAGLTIPRAGYLSADGNGANLTNVLTLSGGAMSGAITTNSTFDGVDIATRDAVLTSTTTTANAALAKAGGALTGPLTTNSTIDGVDIATRDGVLSTTVTTANAALAKAGGTMSGAIDMGSNNITTTGKVLYSNMYAAVNDLPSATTYHGMFAHVHATGKGYFAHSGAWIELANQTDLSSATTTAGAALAKTGGAMTGAITTNSTFDGRDVATDGTKLDTIYPNIPKSGASKTASYTLATTDIGELIECGSSGAVVIPDATFATGDAVLIFNNTTGNITITCSITTAYIGGTNTDESSITLATRGICNVLFISGTVCVVTGNVT